MDYPVNGQLRRVIYKRFRVTSWKDPLAALARPAPALRSWIHGQGFRERGLPTARPFVVLHRKKLGMCREGYLLTEKIDHAADLHEYLQSLDALPAARGIELLRQLIERVAHTIRALHQRQLSHRDLKAANILARRWDAPPDQPSAYSQDIQNLLYMPESSVWLIDLVGVERFLELSRSRRVQNLSRLNASFHGDARVTRTDRLRFLLTYLNCGALGRCDWKSWWKEMRSGNLEKSPAQPAPRQTASLRQVSRKIAARFVDSSCTIRTFRILSETSWLRRRPGEAQPRKGPGCDALTRLLTELGSPNIEKMHEAFLAMSSCFFHFMALTGCELFPHLTATSKSDKIEKDSLTQAGAGQIRHARVAVRLHVRHRAARDNPVLKDLSNLREQVYRDLRLPPSHTEVFVYLFEDRSRYEKFMKEKHPELPMRRAFFVAQAMRKGGTEDLMVYTYWGERIHQDLRHELTHALLHSVLKNVPIWLDEGLAEYFELPPAKTASIRSISNCCARPACVTISIASKSSKRSTKWPLPNIANRGRGSI